MDWIKQNKALSIVLMVVVVALIASVIAITSMKDGNITPGTKPTAAPTGEPTPVPTEEPLTYTEITFLSVGDVMYHRPQLRVAKKGDIYDFTDNMKYVKSIIQSVDYAAANFETTLSNPDVDFLAAPQFPSFNAPDSTVDSLKDAGFDMLFYSNNHCYDFDGAGLKRTLKVFAEKGMDFIGSRPDENSKSYKVVDVKGVKIGLINYMQEIGSEGSTVRINGSSVAPEDLPLIDTFNHNNPEPMYQEIESRMKELENQGADIIIVYMHWGEEYDLEPNSSQKAIAKKLCDMGVGALLASHPHVIQPVEVITSADGKNVMPCFYSMGNFISNQNRDNINKTNGIYTENGLMPILTIKKYSNGETVVSKLDYVSTWVHNNAYKSYTIIPIEKALSDPSAYGLSSGSKIQAAKDMTDGLVKAGIEQYNSQWKDPYPEATLLS
ncbi:MAG: CapA family protein [Ruminococcaceae bacterium]|nr:CapA family protein [Oscillospiraceae bacterium]